MLGADPRRRLVELIEAREAAYRQAHVHIATDGRSVAEVAEALTAEVCAAPGQPAGLMGALDRILIERGASARLAEVLDRDCLPPRAWLIADANVMELHSERILAGLARDGVAVTSAGRTPRRTQQVRRDGRRALGLAVGRRR